MLRTEPRGNGGVTNHQVMSPLLKEPLCLGLVIGELYLYAINAALDQGLVDGRHRGTAADKKNADGPLGVVLERRQHVERKKVTLHIQVLVKLPEALGKVASEVELKRMLHAHGAHLSLDLRRHDRGKERAAQHVVKDEATQVLSGRPYAMGGEGLVDSRQNGRPMRDQPIQKTLLALLEQRDGADAGVRHARRVGHDPRAAVCGGEGLDPELPLGEVGLHEQPVLVALLANHAHQGVNAAGALKLGQDARAVHGKRGEKVRGLHAREAGVDAVADASLQACDSLQAVIGLGHGGADGPRGQVGLLGHLGDCDARGPENAQQDAGLVREVLREERRERLVRRHHEVVVGIARYAARAHGLEPCADAGHLTDDRAAGDPQGPGELGAGARTLVERPKELSLPLA